MVVWMALKFLKGDLKGAIFPLMAVMVGTISLTMTLSLGDGAKNIIAKDLSTIAKNRVLIGGAPLDDKDLELVEKLPFVEYALFPEKRCLIENNLYRAYSKKALKALNLPILREDEVILDKNQFSTFKNEVEIELMTLSEKRYFLIRDFYEEASPFETMKSGNRVIMNNQTFERFFKLKKYNSLLISFQEGEDSRTYIPIILKELNRFRFGQNHIKVLETPDLYKKVTKIKNFMDKVLFSLSLISLSVGGFGILNLIASKMRERTPSIGILLAIGISKKKLIQIFLLEATVVMFLGAFIGIILGISTSFLVGSLLKIPPYLKFIKILAILNLTIKIGLTFGLLPVKKALSLKVVETLKI